MALVNSQSAAAITIYHNPGCGTSRNTLALIRNSGVEPTVIEYLKSPPSRARLVELLAAMRIPARSLLRRKGTPYDELKLEDPQWSEAELIDFMLAHPILINRPIVVTPLGTALCRPSEAVLDLLPSPQRGEFRKEDGELLIDAQGRRVTGDDRISAPARRN
ncbi:MAG: arsenate reductase (glutaredoxin) [Steroidobacteraceae bacterium]